MKTVLPIALVASVALSLAACGAQPVPPQATASPPTAGATTQAASTTQAPPTDPVAAIAWEALMSRDGEYAASATYQAVISAFGAVEPYVSIQAAEERHVQALTRQLDRLGVAVPPNPYVGRIPAPADLMTAARAEATAEVANVAMYDRLLTGAPSDAALTRVLTNLRRASQEMHLPAFRAAADHGGRLSTAEMTALGLG